MDDMVEDGGLDEAVGVEAGEAVRGLALEMGLADEDDELELDVVDDIVGGDVLGFLLADQLGVRADSVRQRRAKPGLVRAAVWGRDGVAIILLAAVGIERPGDRPFGAALALAGFVRREVLAPGEGLVGDGGALAQLLGEMVGKAA